MRKANRINTAIGNEMANVEDSYKRARARLQYAKANKAKMKATLQRVAMFFDEKNVDSMWISVGLYESEGFKVQLNLKARDSLKEPDHMLSVEHLMCDGWEPTHTEDQARWNERTQHFKRGNGERLSVCFKVHDGSSACRSVKTGERVQIIEDFTFHCE